MSSINSLVARTQQKIRLTRLDLHFRKELRKVEKQSSIADNQFTASMTAQARDFYKQFGFNNIDLRWHNYLFAVTGRFYVDYIPENFYHCVIEPLYTRGSDDIEDKAYMCRMLPGIHMVPNVIKNIKGVFFDENENVLSEDDVLRYLNGLQCNMIIKPSRQTGGGTGVQLIESGNFDKAILDKYKSDYIVQKCILQHEQYKEFNPSSVNTEKIISMFFEGEVYILTSILRVGAPGSHTDTASTGRGYTVGINENGQLNKVGYSVFGESRSENVAGKQFQSIRLLAHEKICAEIKKAHKLLSRFEIISWDFAVEENGEPVLIEYNFNYPDVMIYQMNNGPLFGSLTSRVLEDVKKRQKEKD